MLELEERMDTMEQNMERMEQVFTRFMTQTNALMKRMDKRQADAQQQWQEYIAQSDQRWEQRFSQEKQEWEQRFSQEKQEWEQRFTQEKQDWEQRFQESEQRWEQRISKEHKYWNQRWGDLARSMGRIAEDIVAPNIPRLAKIHFGCDKLDNFIVRCQRRNHQDSSKEREFDAIAVWASTVIISETKSTAKIDYINAFVDVLAEITDYFPEYQGKTIIPIFASLSLGEHIVNYLTKKKIYAMAMGGETMELLNVDKISLT